MLWAYARDLFQTPGFGDTIDFVQIKQHYYEVHRTINPTGIVPARTGPAQLADAARAGVLGGRPFGDGTPPGPPPESERVPPGAWSGAGATDAGLVLGFRRVTWLGPRAWRRSRPGPRARFVEA